MFSLKSAGKTVIIVLDTKLLTPENSMQNPYLEEFQSRYNGSYFFHELRDELVKKYAWAVPTEASIEAIAALGPIVEVGAGTGYWAWLLRQVGATVEAYDVAPGDNHWC